MALGIFAATARAADTKQHPLVGATRQQIVARFGEPTSQILTGNREILFFDRERFELVDNVVTFAERIAADPPPPTPTPPPPAASPTLAPSNSRPGSPTRQEGVVPTTSERAPEPVLPKSTTPIQPAPREPEDRVQIRAVRPRSATATTELPTGKDSFPPVQARPEPVADVRETKKSGDDRVGNEVPSNDKAAENKGKKATAPTVVPEKKAKVVRAPRQPSDLDFPS
ncbi:MAG: hypothetical protein ABIZ49_02895, partial [Opitutaceae bacterium]